MRAIRRRLENGKLAHIACKASCEMGCRDRASRCAQDGSRRVTWPPEDTMTVFGLISFVAIIVIALVIFWLLMNFVAESLVKALP